MSSFNCCFLTCIQISQEADQVVWYSHLFQNFPQFIVIHTVKGFGIVNKAEIDVFLNSLAFSMIQRMLAYSVQFSSVAQSCPTLWDPMNHSTPSFPVHHQLLEFTQTHVHPVSDAIQPSHPLLSPSPPVPNPSHHQSLLQWVNSSHEVARTLEFQLQHHSLQRNPRADLLQNGLVGVITQRKESQIQVVKVDMRIQEIDALWFYLLLW